MEPWSQNLDDKVRTASSRITDIPADMGNEAFSFPQIPPAEAGLGFASLRSEAAARYQIHQDSSYSWTGDEMQVFCCYESVAAKTVAAALGAS
eukprot:4605125-Amphidinium_carterae.2